MLIFVCSVIYGVSSVNKFCFNIFVSARLIFFTRDIVTKWRGKERRLFSQQREKHRLICLRFRLNRLDLRNKKQR